jgi:hypothetical protein
MYKILVKLTFCIVTCLIASALLADDRAAERSILEGVYFDRGSSVLKQSVLPYLHPILDEMKSDPSLRITIESHVDASGDQEKDLNLTRNRAQTISNWLIAQGLDDSRVHPMGFGSTQSIDINDGGTEKNTRIEIVKTRQGFPIADFPTIKYQFEPVVDGIEVQHDYLVRNTGTAELLIKEVKTG